MPVWILFPRLPHSPKQLLGLQPSHLKESKENETKQKTKTTKEGLLPVTYSSRKTSWKSYSAHSFISYWPQLSPWLQEKETSKCILEHSDKQIGFKEEGMGWRCLYLSRVNTSLQKTLDSIHSATQNLLSQRLRDRGRSTSCLQPSLATVNIWGDHGLSEISHEMGEERKEQ